MKNIAIIGFGFMGVVHAKNVIESSTLNLCGIIDNREGDIFAGLKSTGNAGELNLPLEKLKTVPVYKNLQTCVNEKQLDAVIICVPFFLHYKIAQQALELELDVLLEKPFCPDLKECAELIKLAKAKECILMVAHCIRFAPEWEFLAECIKDRRYGELQLISTSRMGGKPTWGVWQDDKVKKTCGGSLMDLLIHDIDFINSSLGVPETINVNLKCDEYWEIALQYPRNPAKISIKGGFLHRHSTFESTYAATFTNGSIRFSSLEPGVIHLGTDTGAETINVSGDPYCNELEYFSKSLISRKAPERCLSESSMQAIEVCNKIVNSIGKCNE
ncbi:MAG: Gfo/Idh/MocA family oxidoreductase [Verrucomicrobiota bacterium]|nr:Gfo/Idh/MocA family oxidoreductase [Verrucomicrobiota bacterium]